MKTSSALAEQVERMGRYFPKPVEVLQELRASDDPDATLESWRASMEPSERKKAAAYDEATLTLSAILGVSREEADQQLREYVAEEDA